MGHPKIINLIKARFDPIINIKTRKVHDEIALRR